MTFVGEERSWRKSMHPAERIEAFNKLLLVLQLLLLALSRCLERLRCSTAAGAHLSLAPLWDLERDRYGLLAAGATPSSPRISPGMWKPTTCSRPWSRKYLSSPHRRRRSLMQTLA